MSRHFTLAGIALALGLLTWLWAGTRSLDAGEHGRYTSDLRELQRLDRTLNQDVLHSRVQLLNTYDPLVATEREIRTRLAHLKSPPSFVSGNHATALAAEADDYQNSIAAKQRLIESFKTRGAVLKNSLRYLPTLAGQVAAEAETEDAEIARDVDALLVSVLVYNLTSDEAHAPKIAAAADALQARTGTLTPATASDVGLLLAHVRSILVTKPEVDRIVRGIFDAPVAKGEERTTRAYLAAYDQAEVKAALYRAALLGTSLLLALLVAFAFPRLNRAIAAVSAANAGLEQRVAERTASLDDRNRAMELVLDNVDQGLVTVDAAGRLAKERSPAMDQWVPQSMVGVRPLVWEWFAAIDPKVAVWVELGWEDLFHGVLPFDVIVDQLPKRIGDARRQLAIEYRPIRSGAQELAGILLVITDVTDQAAAEKAEGEGRDMMAAVQRIVADREAFMDFMKDTAALVARVENPEMPRATAFREVHTLKGNTGMYGLATLSSACHVIETRLADEGELTAQDRESIGRLWNGFSGRVQQLIGKAGDERFEVRPEEYWNLVRAVARGKPQAEILHLLTRLQHEPAERRFDRFAEEARSLAERLGKPELAVRVEGKGVWFDRQRFGPFWSSFVHALRNAVDHGIEGTEEDRLAAGKPKTAQLRLSATEDASGFVVSLSDDGRGIDWEQIRAQARRLGLPADTESELIEALFAEGLTTQAEVTEISGRGIGMAAIRGAAREIGGQMDLKTEPGRGTTLTFRFPPASA